MDSDVSGGERGPTFLMSVANPVALGPLINEYLLMVFVSVDGLGSKLARPGRMISTKRFGFRSKGRATEAMQGGG